MLSNKKYVSVVLAMFLLLAVSACTKLLNVDPNRNKTSYPWKSFTLANEVILDNLSTERGYYVFEKDIELYDPTSLYLGVFLGTKPSSGYDILMGSILLQADNSISVTIKEIVPAPDQQVSDVETYPYLLLMIPQANQKDFVVVNEDGEELGLLDFMGE